MRDETLLRVSKQESRFRPQRNKGEWGAGWVQGGGAGQMWDRTRTFGALCEPGQLAGQEHGKLLIQSKN